MRMKTDLFWCHHCWVVQICWLIECSTLKASSFRIWNSSAGIPSSPLALFIAKVSKAYLTSHCRMFCSRLVITPSWLSGSWGLFLYSSSAPERSYPTSKEWLLHGHRRAERSYSMFKVRSGSREKIPLVQGKEQQLRFAGAAMKRYPTFKVRETQVRR